MYAGGGAGGAYGVNNYGSNNLSASSYNSNAQNALANSGFGGGGVGHVDSVTNGQYNGGSGGSGIVIIRYPRNLAPPASTTGNPQVRYNNGYQIYIWTSSGTITF
jgi:hypothetical protein